METEITRDKYLTVKVKSDYGGFITSQSVEANLLFELLQVVKSHPTKRAADGCSECGHLVSHFDNCSKAKVSE